MAKLNNALIGIAGVHYVVSELSRRGMIALPTVRNTAAYDIVVVTTSGEKHANVQVKASSKRANFFRMPPSDSVRAGRFDFYVLVRWLPKENRYEGFMLTGREAKAAVQDVEASQRKSIRSGSRKKIVPAIHVSQRDDSRHAQNWKKRWLEWTL